MPSGAKKRKAAKKKKENQLSNSSSSASVQTHDGDDVNQNDEKESEFGEVSSPTSQDHNNLQNPLTEGEEEENKIEDNIVAVEAASGVQVEREFKIEEDSNKKNGEMEHDEPARKSYDEGSSGSSISNSSSSSDDESRDVKISQAEVKISPVVDSVQANETLSGTTAEVIPNAEIEESGKSVENCPAIVSEEIEAAEIHIATVGGDSVSCEAVESLSKENGETKLIAVKDQVEISRLIVSEAANEERIIHSGENAAEIFDQKVVAPKDDDVLSLSYSAPVPVDYDGAEHEKDPGVNQPLLAPTSRATQTTSWKSCCGLFELFTGSDR